MSDTLDVPEALSATSSVDGTRLQWHPAGRHGAYFALLNAVVAAAAAGASGVATGDPAGALQLFSMVFPLLMAGMGVPFLFVYRALQKTQCRVLVTTSHLRVSMSATDVDDDSATYARDIHLSEVRNVERLEPRARMWRHLVRIHGDDKPIDIPMPDAESATWLCQTITTQVARRREGEVPEALERLRQRPERVSEGG